MGQKPWLGRVSLWCLVQGLQAKACLVGQLVPPKPSPGPRRDSHIASRASSSCSCLTALSVLCPVLPARDPKPACTHFAKNEPETKAQRSQKANLGTCGTRSTWCGPNSRKKAGSGGGGGLARTPPGSNPTSAPLAAETRVGLLPSRCLRPPSAEKHSTAPDRRTVRVSQCHHLA